MKENQKQIISLFRSADEIQENNPLNIIIIIVYLSEWHLVFLIIICSVFH